MEPKEIPSWRKLLQEVDDGNKSLNDKCSAHRQNFILLLDYFNEKNSKSRQTISQLLQLIEKKSDTTSDK